MTQPMTPTNFLGVGPDQFALALKLGSEMFAARFQNDSLLWSEQNHGVRRVPFRGGVTTQVGLLSDLGRPFAYIDGQVPVTQPFSVDEALITLDTKYRKRYGIGETQLRASPFPTLVSEVSTLAADEMMRHYARQAARLICLAARTPVRTKNGLMIHDGGKRVLRAGTNIKNAYPMSTTGRDRLRDDVLLINELLDKSNAPANRSIYFHADLKPLVFGHPEAVAFNSDFRPTSGNNVNRMVIREFMGCQVVGFFNGDSSNGGWMPDALFNDMDPKFNGDFRPNVSQTFGQPAYFVLAHDDRRSPVIFEEFIVNNINLKFDDDLRSYVLDTSMQFKSGIAYPYCVGSAEIVAA